MAKRKRKPGQRQGFKLRPVKDYRSEEYTFYVMNAETGILQASAIDPDLTDGEVEQALDNLIDQLGKPEQFTELLSTQPSEEAKTEGLIESLVLMNLRSAFEKHGPLEAEDVLGILKVIRTSVNRRSVGSHRQGYLTFLEGFLGQMGVTARQLSDEEVEELGLESKLLDDNGD